MGAIPTPYNNLVAAILRAAHNEVGDGAPVHLRLPDGLKMRLCFIFEVGETGDRTNLKPKKRFNGLMCVHHRLIPRRLEKRTKNTTPFVYITLPGRKKKYNLLHKCRNPWEQKKRENHLAVSTLVE